MFAANEIHRESPTNAAASRPLISMCSPRIFDTIFLSLSRIASGSFTSGDVSCDSKMELVRIGSILRAAAIMSRKCCAQEAKIYGSFY